MKPRTIESLEVLAPVSIGGGSLWSLRTMSRLVDVMAPGWIVKRYAHYPLRVHDRLMVTASIEDATAEYAWLVVTKVADGQVEVHELP
jgi:hypothetical protein